SFFGLFAAEAVPSPDCFSRPRSRTPVQRRSSLTSGPDPNAFVQQRGNPTMCGIAGIVDTRLQYVPGLESRLRAMQDLLRHRGPDGAGVWTHPNEQIGFAHQRLSIIELSVAGAQPMTDGESNWISYNGEIYNYVELPEEHG